MQFRQDFHVHCSSDGFVKAQDHILRQTVKDWRNKTIVEVDAHVIIKSRFGFERRDTEIGKGFVCRLEQFIDFAIWFMGVDKLPQFRLQRFEIGRFFGLGDQFCDE